MNESAGGLASITTEQAGPAFAPFLEGRSDPGGEPGCQGSVGPPSTGAVDPEVPGGFSDPAHLQITTHSEEIPALRTEITTTNNSTETTKPPAEIPTLAAQSGWLTNPVFRGRSSSVHPPSSRHLLSPPILSSSPRSEQSRSAQERIGRVQREPVFDMSFQSGHQHVDRDVVQPQFAAEHPSGVATTRDEAVHRLPASAMPAPAYAAQFATVRTDVAVCTSETLTAQALLLLGRSAVSPESSPHSSIHHWLQTAQPSVLPSSQVEPSLSSNPSELHPPLPLGADAAMMAPHHSRTSRVSHSTRRTRRTAVSSVAAEILGFSREMTGHLVNVVGQMQAQAQVQQNLNQIQLNQIVNQNEAIRADAKMREERAEKREKAQIEVAEKREENIRNENLVREQMLVKMKTEADEASCKREQFYMDHEFKRQKLIFDSNTVIQQEKIKSDSHREIACMEVMERRELEFQQLQEKERERAIGAQQKSRELASKELQERIQLDRELLKQQQENLLLQKQAEIERLQVLADQRLFQKAEITEKSASKETQSRENVGTLSPLLVTVEMSDLDTSPASQNRPKPIQNMPVVKKTESETRVITDAGNVVAIGVATGESCAPAPVAARSDSKALAMADSNEKQRVVETQPKMLFENSGVLSSDRPTMVASIAATATTTTVSYVPAGMTRVVQLPQQQQMLPPVWAPPPVASPAVHVSTPVWPPSAVLPPSVPPVAAPPPVTSYAATTPAVHVAPAAPPPAAPAPVMPYTLSVSAAPVAHAVSPLAATIQGTLPPIFAATAAPAAPAVTSSPPGHATLQTPVASLGAATYSTSAASGLPLSCVPALMDFKSLPTGAPVPATVVSSEPAPTLSAAQPVVATPAPTVFIRQHETVRPYTGATSYKTYKEYFSRIASCNGWSNKTDCARHLLVAMDGPAAEAVRGLKAEKDGDLDLIWEALARRFGCVDEPERAMRRFDNRRQLENEALAVYEQNLRTLHREAWPATDLKSPEADSLLRRKFTDGVSDPELQKYLRLHAIGDDFAKTVLKAKHFIEANELSRAPKKPAMRTTTPSVNYQAIVEGVMEALVAHDQGRLPEVNALQTPPTANSGGRDRKTSFRRESPAPSESSTGASSRASSVGRTVRFQEQESRQPPNQGYGVAGRSRWDGNRSPRQNNGNGPRPWGDRQPPAQGSPRLPPSVPTGSTWSPRQGGPRFQPPQPVNQWAPGNGGLRSRPPAPGSGNNWRPSGQPPYQRQPPPVRQQWSPGSAEQQPSGVVNSPQYRSRGCHVCGWPGCHSDFHREGAVSPQAPPAASGCFVCGQRWCHSSRHEGYERPPTPQPPVVPPPGSATVSAGPQSNFQRSPPRGAGTPRAVACPQNN